MTEKESEQKYKEICTPEFLEKLVEISRMYGWEGDYIEIQVFVEDMHRYGGVELPILEPYEIDD